MFSTKTYLKWVSQLFSVMVKFLNIQPNQWQQLMNQSLFWVICGSFPLAISPLTYNLNHMQCWTLSSIKIRLHYYFSEFSQKETPMLHCSASMYCLQSVCEH